MSLNSLLSPENEIVEFHNFSWSILENPNEPLYLGAGGDSLLRLDLPSGSAGTVALNVTAVAYEMDGAAVESFEEDAATIVVVVSSKRVHNGLAH